MNDDTIELSALQAAMSTGGGEEIPNDWNGSLGHVNLAKPVDYTGDWGKIVLTDNRYDLRGTLKYYLWLAQGKPDADGTVTQDHINEVLPHFREAIARYRIYNMFTKAGVPVGYRMSDVIDLNTLSISDGLGQAAKQLYGLMTGSEEKERSLAETGQMVLLSIPANAIHREQFDDHSWFTDEMRNERSPTSKACQVAGRKKIDFRAYMSRRGHDGNHHLTTDCQDVMAKVIAQEKSAIVNSPNPVQYAGEDINGKDLKDVFYTGEAVKGRYPAGVLGKAAILIGIGMMKAMMIHIGSRVKVSGAGSITTNSDHLSGVIKNTSFPHEMILRIGNAMGPTLAIVYGFMLASKIIKEDDYLAFSNHAKRYPSDLSAGKSIAQSLSRTAPHREAISTSLEAVLNAINIGLVNAANLGQGSDGSGPAITTLPSVMNPLKLQAEVGMTTGAGDGAVMFYDTGP